MRTRRKIKKTKKKKLPNNPELCLPLSPCVVELVKELPLMLWGKPH